MSKMSHTSATTYYRLQRQPQSILPRERLISPLLADVIFREKPVASRGVSARTWEVSFWSSSGRTVMACETSASAICEGTPMEAPDVGFGLSWCGCTAAAMLVASTAALVTPGAPARARVLRRDLGRSRPGRRASISLSSSPVPFAKVKVALSFWSRDAREGPWYRELPR